MGGSQLSVIIVVKNQITKKTKKKNQKKSKNQKTKKYQKIPKKKTINTHNYQKQLTKQKKTKHKNTKKMQRIYPPDLPFTYNTHIRVWYCTPTPRDPPNPHNHYTTTSTTTIALKFSSVYAVLKYYILLNLPSRTLQNVFHCNTLTQTHPEVTCNTP